MIVPGILVCSRFLISVCMFIVSNVLLISSATVISRAGGAIWLNPFATVLFTVCSAVTVVLCFVPVLRGCLRLCKEEGSSPVSMSLLGFGMGTMLANFHMCGIKLVLRTFFNRLMRNASPGGPMCFRCLMFWLSGHSELLTFLCFITSWTWVEGSVMLYPCNLCDARLVYLFVLCV